MLAEHHRGGDGPPLLLVHGFTATWRAWTPVIELLEPLFDVLAVTLPGHTGGPPVDESNLPAAFADGLEEMLDEVGWERPHVAGFSLGGQLACELAVRGRVRSVTAIAPGGAQESIARETERIAKLFKRLHKAANTFGAVNERFSGSATYRRLSQRDMMADGSRIPPETAVEMAKAFAATPVFKAFLADDVDRLPRGLDRIDVPVTVLWGDKDRVLPFAKHEAFWREHLPAHAEFRVLKHAGHVPFWDAPERLADGIAQTALRADREREGTAA